MPTAGLERITVEGFTSIESAEVNLDRLNVLVGANGSGKSNFVRALEFLGRIVDEDLSLHVGKSGGASALLNAVGAGARMRLTVDGPPNRYQATLESVAKDELVFVDERIFFHGRQPWDHSIGRGHRETALHSTARGRGRGVNVAPYVIDLLRGCRVYHFHDTSPSAAVKKLSPTADSLSLHHDAGNLAAVLLALRDNPDERAAAAYRRIQGAVRQVAPFFRDFVLVAEAADRVRLRWRQVDSDVVFSADQMSDGTLRFVCLVTLLLQPELPALVVLDEPELGLHPYAIVQLAGLLQQAAHRSQVVLATQSVTLMNQFELHEPIVVELGAHGSTFVRPDPVHLQSWLQEYSLGELWEKNVIGGRPGSVAGLADG